MRTPSSSAATPSTLCAMLALQDQMNTRVNPQWREQHYPWHRAIWTEAAELLEHYGWKWWKKQTPDLLQIQLELVDIWHFVLSEHLEKYPKGGNADHYTALATALVEQWNAPAPAAQDFRETVEAMVLQVLSKNTLPLPLFRAAMQQVDFSFDNLYRQYIGKNVLNLFRQEHGYQQGTYQKEWHGKEDNLHLAEILEQAIATPETLQAEVYAALKARYPR
ncbi:Conserved hypothetical protein [gamma proteobacterium HdN1]|nr:Conserved hypothetical protein [gamma proteobacterium HdN1]